MSTPEAVEAYLRAKFDDDTDGLPAAFGPDAFIRDDGADHVGAAAIRGWAGAVSRAFTVTRTVLGTHTVGPATIAQVEIAGDFPGSPVVLHHHFTVGADGLIAALTICP